MVWTIVFTADNEERLFEIIDLDRSRADATTVGQRGLARGTLDARPCYRERVPVEKAIVGDFGVLSCEKTKVRGGGGEPERLHNRVQRWEVFVFLGDLSQSRQMELEHVFYAWTCFGIRVGGSETFYERGEKLVGIIACLSLPFSIRA